MVDCDDYGYTPTLLVLYVLTPVGCPLVINRNVSNGEVGVLDVQKVSVVYHFW